MEIKKISRKLVIFFAWQKWKKIIFGNWQKFNGKNRTVFASDIGSRPQIFESLWSFFLELKKHTFLFLLVSEQKSLIDLSL